VKVLRGARAETNWPNSKQQMSHRRNGRSWIERVNRMHLMWKITKMMKIIKANTYDLGSLV
jgi:hypothetical protein